MEILMSQVRFSYRKGIMHTYQIGISSNMDYFVIFQLKVFGRMSYFTKSRSCLSFPRPTFAMLTHSGTIPDKYCLQKAKEPYYYMKG